MLTDERRLEILTSIDAETKRLPPGLNEFARAIESAACAERDARIAELEALLTEKHNARVMWQTKAAELERQLAEARKDAERWRTFLSTRPQSTHEVINQAIDDAAIRAMKKEQQ